MLRFTKQVDYGLMVMQYIAEHQGDAPVGVKRIADQFGRTARQGPPAPREGRPHGGPERAARGYRLTLPPSAVTVGQVIRVLEGPLAIVSCMAHRGDCVQASRCTLRNPARRLQAAITDLLDTMTLAELAGDDVPAALAAQR